ncbi:MAG TPA: hypothetical protein DCQ50_11730 [Chryseobacterium sp.]|nr:hypothetical protein [Chryseobacterium sp.]
MKITAFRLGNIVSLAYDPERYGVIISMDLSGQIHLSNKETPDDIRDTIGIEVTEKLLSKFGCETAIYINGTEIIISFSGKRVTVTIDGVSYQISFLHQLQNIFYVNTGQELIDLDRLIYLIHK